MIPEFGQLCLIFALCLATAQAVFPLAGAQLGKPGWMAVALPAAAGHTVFVLGAFAALAFIGFHEDGVSIHLCGVRVQLRCKACVREERVRGALAARDAGLLLAGHGHTRFPKRLVPGQMQRQVIMGGHDHVDGVALEHRGEAWQEVRIPKVGQARVAAPEHVAPVVVAAGRAVEIDVHHILERGMDLQRVLRTTGEDEHPDLAHGHRGMGRDVFMPGTNLRRCGRTAGGITR